MKSAIVTGATGFIGTGLVDNLLKNGYDITVIVRNEYKSRSNIAVIKCDLAHAETLPEKIKKRGFDVFYHIAWEGSSGDDRMNKDLQAKNIGYSIKCANVAAELGCKRFVFPGSLTELSIVPDADGTMPAIGHYAVSKGYAATATQLICSTDKVEHLVGRLPSTYGKGCKGFIARSLEKMLRNEDVEFNGGLTDFAHIDDVSEALRLIGELGVSGTTYQIGSGSPGTTKSFMEEMKRITGSKSKIICSPSTDRILLTEKDLSIDNLVKDTGYSPKVRFADGIKSISARANI